MMDNGDGDELFEPGLNLKMLLSKVDVETLQSLFVRRFL